MNKTGLWVVVRRELARIPKFKGFVTIVTVIPIITILFFALTFMDGTPRKLPVAVYDTDHSTLSRKAIRMVGAAPTVDVLYEVSSVDEGRELMMKGKVDAVLVLPKGMERMIYRQEKVEAPLFVSVLKILNSSLIYRDIFTTLSTFSSGIEVQFLMKGGLAEHDAMQKILPVYYEKHSLFNPYTSYAYFLLPGFLLLIVSMFAIVSAVFTIGVELKRGSGSEWLSVSGGNIIKAVMGKLLPYTILYYLLYLICCAIMYGWMGQPFRGEVGGMLLLALLYIVSCQCFGVIVISLLGNLGLSCSISAGFSIMAFSFSGLTFTIEAMYKVVQFFSNIFPYKHFTRIFIDYAVRGAGISASVWSIVALFAFIAIALLMLIRLGWIVRRGYYCERESLA